MRSILIVLLLLSFVGYTQEENAQQLAQYYYTKGEFTKALPYCESAFKQEPSKFTFVRFYNCLLQTENDKEAEKLLKKQIQKYPSYIEYPVMLATFNEKHGETKAAAKLFEKLIEENSTTSDQVLALYQEFRGIGKMEYALELLQQGRKNLKKTYPLHLQFAAVYAFFQEKEKMITEFLDLLEEDPTSLEQVENSLAFHIDFSKSDNPDSDLVKDLLLKRVQNRNANPNYSELLLWYFTQRKQFNLALNQAQALDKIEKGNGIRVLELASIFLQNKEYDLARKGFSYVIQLNNPLIYRAEEAKLHAYFMEITDKRNLSLDTIHEIINIYNQGLDRLKRFSSTISVSLELSHILAFYAHRMDEAIEELNRVLKYPGVSREKMAEAKMLLADIYVLKNEIWEASILYMQIDTEFKFEPIGFEAKFKNARVFYYDGDFAFAQSQLDILKQSTSKLIANDALKLSLLITDNYGLDSNYIAMQQFAQADLLLEQHQYDKAFEYFDSITTAFPYHSLGDEILLRKSLAYQYQGKWQEAIQFLEELLKYHKQDILADDAVFQLGDIYQNHLNNSEKAMQYFKEILFDFKGSLYTVEARKRVRLLRGDAMDIEDKM